MVGEWINILLVSLGNAFDMPLKIDCAGCVGLVIVRAMVDFTFSLNGEVQIKTILHNLYGRIAVARDCINPWFA